MSFTSPIRTAAPQRALDEDHEQNRRDDLTYFVNWEQNPTPGLAALFRIRQLRRANPAIEQRD